MAKVVDQEIPSEFYDLYMRYMDPAHPNDGVQLTKHHDGRQMSSTLRVVMQNFREGTRMWSTKTKPEREPWETEGAKWGMDGRAYFMKEFLLGCLGEGAFKVGTFTVGSWGGRDTQYVGARNRFRPGTGDVVIHTKFQVGFSKVGGEGEVS